MSRQIVHHDDIARLQCRDKNLFDIDLKDCAVHGTVMDEGSGHAVVSGRPRAPAPVHGRSFFECPSVLPQPATEHAATDPDITFALQARHHLVKRDVFLRFDHAENEVFMPVQP